MSSISSTNFLLRKDTRSKSSWPLPPSSVFKLQTAQPWIAPEEFGIGIPHDDSISNAFAVEDVNENTYEEILDYQDTNNPVKCYTINEEDDSGIYAELIDVYGLPLPNSQIQVIEYSDNPEKGIDLWNTQTKLEDNAFTEVTDRVAKRNGRAEQSGESPSNKFTTTEMILGGSKSGSISKKKWSPFSKDKTQSWKLFY